VQLSDENFNQENSAHGSYYRKNKETSNFFRVVGNPSSKDFNHVDCHTRTPFISRTCDQFAEEVNQFRKVNHVSDGTYRGLPAGQYRADNHSQLIEQADVDVNQYISDGTSRGLPAGQYRAENRLSNAAFLSVGNSRRYPTEQHSQLIEQADMDGTSRGHPAGQYRADNRLPDAASLSVGNSRRYPTEQHSQLIEQADMDGTFRGHPAGQYRADNRLPDAASLSVGNSRRYAAEHHSQLIEQADVDGTSRSHPAGQYRADNRLLDATSLSVGNSRRNAAEHHSQLIEQADMDGTSRGHPAGQHRAHSRLPDTASLSSSNSRLYPVENHSQLDEHASNDQGVSQKTDRDVVSNAFIGEDASRDHLHNHPPQSRGNQSRGLNEQAGESRDPKSVFDKYSYASGRSISMKDLLRNKDMLDVMASPIPVEKQQWWFRLPHPQKVKALMSEFFLCWVTDVDLSEVTTHLIVRFIIVL
jgi:hypothetical protein